MDTSPEYIKKCAKAEEIQNKVSFTHENYGHQKDDSWDGSLFALPFFEPIGIALFHLDADEGRWIFGDYYSNDNSRGFIWLPRQDQLQEMVEFTKQGITNCVYRYALEAIQRFADEQNDHFGSWEQLWLAFVMKEKFNKIWNGEEWVITPK